MNGILSDDDIRAAIAQHDDPDHDDAYSVEEVREAIAEIEADTLSVWDEMQDAIDDGAHDVVYETSDVIVLADDGHYWGDAVRYADLDDEHGIMHSILRNVAHTAAKSLCDYSWSVKSPVVIEKPAEFQSGESNALREIARRTEEFGSVARAVDSLATEVHNWNKGDWARLTSRNPSTVSRTTDN